MQPIYPRLLDFLFNTSAMQKKDDEKPGFFLETGVIEMLKKKRQKNVQEQNALNKYYIMEYALDFRRNRPLPEALIKCFEDRGIDMTRAVLTWHDRMPFGGPTMSYRGSWLTQDLKFIEYIIYLDPEDKYVTEVEEWNDITDQIELNEHKPGTGKTGGQLCIRL